MWLHEAIQAADTDRTGRALEQTLTMPVVKILAVLIWIPGMPHSGWEPMHIVMGWLHLTGYVAFGLSGVVDISARHGKIGSRATYFALAGASLINALLFWVHGAPPDVEGTAHLLLILMFVSVAMFALLEATHPNSSASWFRIGSMIGLGIWMIITGWIVDGSGWASHDHVRVAQVWLIFAWTILVVATVTTLASVWSLRLARVNTH